MATIKTVITNGVISIDFNTDITKQAMFELAVSQGFAAGKTSFTNLVNGKIKSAAGFEMKDVVEIEEPAVVATSAGKVAALDIFHNDTMKVVKTSLKTYGTVEVSLGRVRIKPVKEGMYAVRVYARNGAKIEDVQTTVGGIIRSRYVTLGQMNASEVQSLLAKLA